MLNVNVTIVIAIIVFVVVPLFCFLPGHTPRQRDTNIKRYILKCERENISSNNPWRNVCQCTILGSRLFVYSAMWLVNTDYYLNVTNVTFSS